MACAANDTSVLILCKKVPEQNKWWEKERPLLYFWGFAVAEIIIRVAKQKMVARSFQVHYNDSTYGVDYDTGDGLEVSLSLSISLSKTQFLSLTCHSLQVFKIQIFSLTSIPPDEQKVHQFLHISLAI